MSYHVSKPCKPILRIICFFLRIYFNRMHRVQMDISALDSIKPPFLLIANHVNNWDPFLAGAYTGYPIQYVTNDHYFRKPILRFLLLKIAGAIPITKSMTDSQAVKNVVRVSKNNGVIGLFPEGHRSWDGKTLPLIRSTAKLVKLLKIPVICAVIQGAHLACPRWSDHIRKGPIRVSYHRLCDEQTIRKSSVDEIYEKMSAAIAHDEYAYQERYMHKYRSKRRAERLELMLCICPKCKCMDSLAGNGHLFICSNCTYTVTLTETGHFASDKNEVYFPHPPAWLAWQRSVMVSMINQADKDTVIFENNGCTLTKANDKNEKIIECTGTARFYIDRLVFSAKKDVSHTFFLQKIIGLVVQSNRYLEFYHEHSRYHVSFEPHVCVLKYVDVYDYLKQEKGREKT